MRTAPPIWVINDPMCVAVNGPPSLSQLSFDARPWGSDNFGCRYHRTPGASITILLSNPRGMVRDCCRTARARLKTALIGNLLPTFENCTCRAYCQAGDWAAARWWVGRTFAGHGPRLSWSRVLFDSPPSAIPHLRNDYMHAYEHKCVF